MDAASQNHQDLLVGRPKLLGERAARRELGDIGRTFFWSLIKQGRLDVVRISRRTFVTTESVDRLIEDGRETRNA